MGRHTQQVQCIGVARIDADDFLIQGFGLLQLARLVNASKPLEVIPGLRPQRILSARDDETGDA